MRLFKNLQLCVASLLILTSASFANADVNKVTDETFYFHQPFQQVISIIQNNLQRCVTKEAGFFNSGRKLVAEQIDTAIIYHIKQYQTTGEIIGDFGRVVISKEPTVTVVAVTNKVDIAGENLHLIESLKKWSHGDNRCIPTTSGVFS